jgi:hypothetical protein
VLLALLCDRAEPPLTSPRFPFFQASLRASSDAQHIAKLRTDVDADGTVHGLPNVEAVQSEPDSSAHAAGAAPAPVSADTATAAVVPVPARKARVAEKSDASHLSADTERSQLSAYYENLEKQEEAQIEKRRAVRARRTQEMQREKEAENARIAREVAHSAGAGNLYPGDKSATKVQEEEKEESHEKAEAEQHIASAQAQTGGSKDDGKGVPSPPLAVCTYREFSKTLTMLHVAMGN